MHDSCSQCFEYPAPKGCIRSRRNSTQILAKCNVSVDDLRLFLVRPPLAGSCRRGIYTSHEASLYRRSANTCAFLCRCVRRHAAARILSTTLNACRDNGRSVQPIVVSTTDIIDYLVVNNPMSWKPNYCCTVCSSHYLQYAMSLSVRSSVPCFSKQGFGRSMQLLK